MKQKFAFALVTLAGLGFALPAAAQIDVQGLIDQLTANGYQVRETHTVQNQVRVEAQYGTQRVEMVYDNTTGALISQESSSGTRDRVQDGTEDGPDRDQDRDRDGSGSDDSDDDSSDDDDNGSDDDHGGSDDSGSDDSDHGGSDDSDHGGSDDSGSDDSGDDSDDD